VPRGPFLAMPAAALLIPQLLLTRQLGV